MGQTELSSRPIHYMMMPHYSRKCVLHVDYCLHAIPPCIILIPITHMYRLECSDYYRKHVGLICLLKS